MSLEKRRLAWQQPIFAKKQQRFVYSQAELESTLSDIVSLGSGKGIVINLCGDIILDKTVNLPSQCSGLIIQGGGNIKFADSVTFGFSISGSSMIIQDLLITGPLNGGVIKINSVTRPSNATGIILSKLRTFACSSGATIIRVSQSLCLINNCILSGSGIGGSGIVLDSNPDSVCALTANFLNGRTITSNASAGFNTIVGNVNCGVITAAGTDQVGLNT